MFNISPHDLAEINHLVPDIHARPQRSDVPASSQYLLKSHFPWSANPHFGSYRRVIYLMRDPRDVMLSYYRYEVGQNGRQGDLISFANDWVNGRVWPGSWQDHITSWLGPRNSPPSFSLEVFRYEDFVTAPVEQTTKLAGLLDISVSSDRIESVVADTQPDIMRQREKNGKGNAKPTLQFIGPAVSGGWKDQIRGDNLKALRILEEHAGEVMREHGYTLSTEMESLSAPRFHAEAA